MLWGLLMCVPDCFGQEIGGQGSCVRASCGQDTCVRGVCVQEICVRESCGTESCDRESRTHEIFGQESCVQERHCWRKVVLNSVLASNWGVE